MISASARRTLATLATVAAAVLTIALSGAHSPAGAQQPASRADTVPTRADYRDLDELLQKLPRVTPPAIDEARALWLGAFPLACLDRLQSRPGARGRGRGGSVDTSSSSRAAGAADSNGRAVSPPPAGPGTNAGGPANSGAGYFWVPTYRLVADHDRLRAFWGCTDWHSAVGSTWATVRLLRTFPGSVLAELEREKLNAHLGRSNLDGELSFFRTLAASVNPIPSASQQGLYERPYGFASLLELQAELHTWPDTQARRWASNVAPLAQWMADSLGAYFSKLVEPVRAGTQNNTAHNMSMALDYADAVGDTRLRRSVAATAHKLFLADTTCATQSEAVIAAAGGRGGGRGGGGRGAGGGGRAAANSDSAARAALPNDLSASNGRGNAPPGGQVVLSPCLSEAALMSRVLEARPYLQWLGQFLPPLQSGRFAPLTEAIAVPLPAPVPAARAGRAGATDSSTAGAAAAIAAVAALATERARVAGLSLSRADDMERIARALPAHDPRIAAWHRLAAIQADRGMALMRDDAAGSHWLPAQALMYEKDAKTAVPIATTTESIHAQPRVGARTDTTAHIAAFTDLASFYASLPVVKPHGFDMATALQLSAMPLSCMDHPEPRPNAPPYLWEADFTPVPDYETTRAFYGCYDWHSAVNSAWTLVRILKTFPTLPTAPAIRQKLNDHFGATNIAGDLDFLRGAGTFELPYGYAWLLRLQYELRSWGDSDAVRWADNMQPMATYMSHRLAAYLAALPQAVRTGVHPNTAMAMDNALGYARAFDPELESAIRLSAERLFGRDVRCNTAVEPGPSDFASPCLMEAAVMGQLMAPEAFVPWLNAFLPPVYSAEFRPLTKGLGPEFVKNPAAVASKSHIVGLAFVRATSLGELANALPPGDARVPVLERLAAIQAATGFPLMGAVGYDGSHYYASWATTYLITHPQSGYVTVSDGARLYYRTSGQPGPGIDTLIAIHGGPGLDLGTIYNDMAEMFGDRHVVIYYDQRGGGRSDLPADTSRLYAARQIQDLDDLRRHFGLNKVTLVAHSYGPLLAASYAIAHPANVRKLIFFGPVPPRRGDYSARYGRNFNARLDSMQRRAMNAANRQQLDSTQSDSAARAGCRDYWKIGMRPRLSEPDRTWPLMKADFCETDLRGIRYGARYGTRVITNSFGDWDLRPALASLHVPLLVLHGEDETIPMDLVEEWVTSMPKGMATLIRVPRAAHFVYLERPELVWPAVERFLSTP